MANGKFASTGVVVGQTKLTGWQQRLQHQKGAKVTMGHGSPLSTQGAVGDITIRKLTNKGFRAYVKTNTGWVDINLMVAQDIIKWIDMNLAANITHDTAGLPPQYSKDTNGFVHLRGLFDHGGTLTHTITTLPEGFRPAKTVYVPGVHAYSVGGNLVYKITEDGVITAISGANADSNSFDGVSFFAWQDTSSSGGGGGGHIIDPGDGGHSAP